MNAATRKRIGSLILFTIIWMGTAFGAPMPASEASEGGLTDYDQQALIVVKLGLSDVEWPTVTMANGIKVVNICVIGNSPAFIKSLTNFQTAAAKKIKINIAQIDDGTSMSACNIAYVPKSKSNYRETLSTIIHLPILTVSPISGFAAGGGIVELSVKEVSQSGGAPTNSRAMVNLIINNKSAAAANIKITPELLESASEVIR